MNILYFLVGKPSLMLLQKTQTTNLFQKRTDLEDLTGVKDREWAQNTNMMIEKKKQYQNRKRHSSHKPKSNYYNVQCKIIFILALWEDKGNSMEAAEEYNLFALDNFFCQNNTLFSCFSVYCHSFPHPISPISCPRKPKKL